MSMMKNLLPSTLLGIVLGVGTTTAVLTYHKLQQPHPTRVLVMQAQPRQTPCQQKKASHGKNQAPRTHGQKHHAKVRMPRQTAAIQLNHESLTLRELASLVGGYTGENFIFMDELGEHLHVQLATHHPMTVSELRGAFTTVLRRNDLVEIPSGQVKVIVQGRRDESGALHLVGEPMPQRAPAAPRDVQTEAAAKAPRAVEAHKISRDHMDHALATLVDNTSAKAIPTLKGEEFYGLKLFAIPSNSPLSALGLRNGDVLRSVNGEEIDSLSEASKLFRDLKGDTAAQLGIQRRGNEVLMRYQVK